MAASVPYAWRSVCFVRPITSGCFVRARPACVRWPALKGARALRKRATGSIHYATLLEISQSRQRVRDMYKHCADCLDTRMTPYYGYALWKPLAGRLRRSSAVLPGVAHRLESCRLDKSSTFYSLTKPVVAYSRGAMSSAAPSFMSSPWLILHLCQHRLHLGEPEGHLHSAV